MASANIRIEETAQIQKLENSESLCGIFTYLIILLFKFDGIHDCSKWQTEVDRFDKG